MNANIVENLVLSRFLVNFRFVITNIQKSKINCVIFCKLIEATTTVESGHSKLIFLRRHVRYRVLTKPHGSGVVVNMKTYCHLNRHAVQFLVVVIAW